MLALLVASLAASAGCGGSGNTVWVTGKLLKGGSAYVPPKGQLVSVTFVVIEAKDDSGKSVQGGEPYLADVDQANGTFSVPGPDRQGIPPGRYRVAVTQKLTREEFNAANPVPKKGVDREKDMLSGRFSLHESPIIREVKASAELIIDLDRPQS
jgi:hypothetical protein